MNLGSAYLCCISDFKETGSSIENCAIVSDPQYRVEIAEQYLLELPP